MYLAIAIYLFSRLKIPTPTEMRTGRNLKEYLNIHSRGVVTFHTWQGLIKGQQPPKKQKGNELFLGSILCFETDLWLGFRVSSSNSLMPRLYQILGTGTGTGGGGSLSMEDSPFEYMCQSLIDEAPGHMGRQTHTTCFEILPRFILGLSRKGKVRDLS